MNRHRSHGTGEGFQGLFFEGRHTIRGLSILPTREERQDQRDTQPLAEVSYGLATRGKTTSTDVKEKKCDLTITRSERTKARLI
jgi:hypothetical protein